ncbi:hypothetical protein GUITHDRAFT_103374 [Guillardia theta CCMP2712]|uniref:Tudor domain-containing protein n=1 Tax=Guillardia theta (strain CCMP2712) TaxID=905079 RepID=L1JR97_GUITC|nr:hypothetical protein GUITHDRAFT_103374 [Guillardia theta CCMP2712]EKX50784.1 hypothetical protein GUITHDRAFT_103374 [Guillardia theta CCMP2712]|eukprot:XP_005837764.1 hypothetical protein GUITHDRAFT_103374 [Guillardia theta CCMP2712]
MFNPLSEGLERTEWILYRDGEVVTTITEDELDAADPLQGGGTSLTDPIAAARMGPMSMMFDAFSALFGMMDRSKSRTADPGLGYRLFEDGLGFGEKKAPEVIDGAKLAEAMENEAKAADKATEKATPIEKSKEEVEQEKRDQAWILIRREGILQLKEAEIKLRAGVFDEAESIVSTAIARFQEQLSTGTVAAEDLIEQGKSLQLEISRCAKGQVEARAEAIRLADEAGQWLKNGDLDSAIIYAERAQGALREVETYYGRITTEELTKVLEIKVLSDIVGVMQEMEQQKQQSSEASVKRQQVEEKKRQELVDSKRSGKIRNQEIKQIKSKNSGGRFAEAVDLAERAIFSFGEAGRKGYRKAETEMKSCKSILDRALIGLEEKSVPMVDENEVLESLFSVESIDLSGGEEPSVAKPRSSPGPILSLDMLRSSPEKLAPASSSLYEALKTASKAPAEQKAPEAAREEKKAAAATAGGATVVRESYDMLRSSPEKLAPASSSLYEALKTASKAPAEQKAPEAAREEKKAAAATAGGATVVRESYDMLRSSPEKLAPASSSLYEALKTASKAPAEQKAPEAAREEKKAAAATAGGATVVRESYDMLRSSPEKLAPASSSLYEALKTASKAPAEQKAPEAAREEKKAAAATGGGATVVRESYDMLRSSPEKLAPASSSLFEALKTASKAPAEQKEIYKSDPTTPTEEKSKDSSQVKVLVAVDWSEVELYSQPISKIAAEMAQMSLLKKQRNEKYAQSFSEEKSEEESTSWEALKPVSKPERPQLAVGTLVEAKWYEDNKWYEAEVLEVTKDGKYTIVSHRGTWQMFTEYGDEQETDPKDLKLKEFKPTEKNIPRSSSSFSASESSYASLGLKKPLDRSESIIEAARRQQELQPISGTTMVTLNKGGVAVGEKRYEMNVKYHGILLGKKGLTVKAIEQASGAKISFEKDPVGAIVIRGTEKQREEAWKLVKGVQATLPQLLTQIRELKSRPNLTGRLQDKDQVWPVAINEAIARARGQDAS